MGNTEADIKLFLSLSLINTKSTHTHAWPQQKKKQEEHRRICPTLFYHQKSSVTVEIWV